MNSNINFHSLSHCQGEENTNSFLTVTELSIGISEYHLSSLNLQYPSLNRPVTSISTALSPVLLICYRQTSTKSPKIEALLSHLPHLFPQTCFRETFRLLNSSEQSVGPWLSNQSSTPFLQKKKNNNTNCRSNSPHRWFLIAQRVKSIFFLFEILGYFFITCPPLFVPTISPSTPGP